MRFCSYYKYLQSTSNGQLFGIIWPLYLLNTVCPHRSVETVFYITWFILEIGCWHGENTSQGISLFFGCSSPPPHKLPRPWFTWTQEDTVVTRSGSFVDAPFHRSLSFLRHDLGLHGLISPWIQHVSFILAIFCRPRPCTPRSLNYRGGIRCRPNLAARCHQTTPMMNR